MYTILVIEDNEGDQFYNKIMLEKHLGDVTILTAYDGVEALEVLEKHGELPDVVLLDINMPRMNGLEFLEHFSIGNTRHIPVVVMLTSSNQTSDKERSLGFQCVKDYLMKPISERAMETIRHHAESIRMQAVN